MSVVNILAIVLVVLSMVAVILIAYLYLKDMTLDEIRGEVYHLFLKAEHTYTETGSGKQKLKWVVQQARGLLPAWLRLVVTEEVLTFIIDGWFNAVKDLLDDGKLNRSEEDDLK